jgi:2-oxoglutarate dehydrogenase E2 component (dihydrolipoamide succinyltransferase)
MRKNIIALSLFEAAKVLREQEMPAAPAPAPVGGEVAGTAPMDTESGEPIDLDAVIERLNIIRSGKSFGDPEVYGKLTTMFKAMADEEKTKLYDQLKNIGAIVQSQTPKAGEVPAAPEMAAPEAAPPAPAPTPAPAAPAPTV